MPSIFFMLLLIEITTIHLDFIFTRKKTINSNLYIHSFSNHTDSAKLGAITSIFLRAYRLCGPEFIDQEIAFLTKVFSKFGYNFNFINGVHYKARRTYYAALDIERQKFERVLRRCARVVGMWSIFLKQIPELFLIILTQPDHF